MKIVAQIFGVIAVILIFVSIQQNNKKRVLLFQILSNIFYGLQYLFLQAYSGLGSCVVGLIRCLVFNKYCTNKNKKNPLWALILFIVLAIINGIVTYNDLFSLLTILSIILYTFALWQNNLKVFRIIAFLNPILWLIYNFHVGAYAGIVSSIVEMVSAVIAIYRFDIKKEKPDTKKL